MQTEDQHKRDCAGHANDLIYVNSGVAFGVFDPNTLEMRAVFTTYTAAVLYRLKRFYRGYQVRHLFLGGAWLSVNDAAFEDKQNFKDRVRLAGNPRPCGTLGSTLIDILELALRTRPPIQTSESPKNAEMHESPSST